MATADSQLSDEYHHTTGQYYSSTHEVQVAKLVLSFDESPIDGLEEPLHRLPFVLRRSLARD